MKIVFGGRDKAQFSGSKKYYVPAAERDGYDPDLIVHVPPIEIVRPGGGRVQGKKRRNARARASRQT